MSVSQSIVLFRRYFNGQRRTFLRTFSRWCGQYVVEFVVIICFMFNAGCVRTPQSPGPLTIVVSGDTAGWIVPCGCTSNQSGGLLRRGTFVRSLKKKSAVLVADVGGAAAGTSLYDCAKFEAILSGELEMGVMAHNIGFAEARLGAESLREIASRLHAPFISCNVRDKNGELIVESHRIVTLANRRIALVGVLSETQGVPDIQIEAPRTAILNLLPTLKGKYDHLIVLAYLPETELRALAADLPEADAVIGGPTGQSIAPTQVGPRWVGSATNKGKFLITLTTSDNSKTWDGAVHELNETIADDAKQKQNLDAFHQVLAKQDFTAQQTSFASVMGNDLNDELKFVGSDRCIDCHRSAHDTWKSSRHTYAWVQLTVTNSHVDSYCQQCHTTGFGAAGGFASVGRSPNRVSVGCEDCHGAGSAHVAEPTVHLPFFQQAKFRCERCHDRENSPEFSYETYWPRIAHGGNRP